MKKMLSVIMVGILLVLSCTAAVCAVNAPVITVGSAQGYAGDTLDIPITLTANDGLIGCRLFVSYNASVLTLTGAEAGTTFAGDYLFSNDTTANPFTVIWCDALSEVNHTESGVLCVLHFTVSSDAEAGEYALGVTYDASSTFDVDLQNTACVVENGSVRVQAQETGGWHFSEDCTLRIWTDGTYSYVTGLDVDDPYVSDYVVTTGGWSFSVTPNDMNMESTGAVLSIFDAEDTLVEEYDVVLFGDVDGDGQCTVNDTLEIIAVIGNKNDKDWAQCFADTAEYAYSMAADLAHNGEIDIADAVEMIGIVRYLQEPNQLWMTDDDYGCIPL